LVIGLRILKAADRALPARPVSAALGQAERLFGLHSVRRTNCERDAVIVDELGQWLRASSAPSFAYVHLMSPHIPYDPPPAIDPYAGDRRFSNAEQIELLQHRDALEPERAERLERLYDATVGHADVIVGRILELLREQGRYDDSIVVVTADHGEEFHEHGHWGHGKSLYDELVRVPLVMRGPGIGAGRVVSEPVMLVDVLPTLAKLVGLDRRPAWDGVDVGSLVSDRLAYAELIREGGFESYMAVRQLRKYIETSAGLGEPLRAELYDLASDPFEHANLGASSASAAELADVLARLRRTAADKRVERAQVELDDAAEERLHALGYVN
jgi:arylsulfatase A-like enzyme